MSYMLQQDSALAPKAELHNPQMVLFNSQMSLSVCRYN